MTEMRTYRTTSGRKYRMRTERDEKAEQMKFNLALALVPFFGTVLLMAAWLAR